MTARTKFGIMSSSLFRKVVAYAGLWAGVTFFVVLLTMVFSFLGTIICAALAGMMMGATKPSRWLSVPMSLLCPAIIFIVLRVTKAELSHQQMGLVSALCFGIFWALYVGAAWLMAVESKQAPAQSTSPARDCAGSKSPTLERTSTPPTSRISATPTLRELAVADLQGTWLCDDTSVVRRRIMKITQDRIGISVLNGSGEPSELAAARFRLISSGQQPSSISGSMQVPLAEL